MFTSVWLELRSHLDQNYEWDRSTVDGRSMLRAFHEASRCALAVENSIENTNRVATHFNAAPVPTLRAFYFGRNLSATSTKEFDELMQLHMQ